MKRSDLDRCQEVLRRALEENKQMRRKNAEMAFLAKMALRTCQEGEQDTEVLVRVLKSIVNLSKESE